MPSIQEPSHVLRGIWGNERGEGKYWRTGKRGCAPPDWSAASQDTSSATQIETSLSSVALLCSLAQARAIQLGHTGFVRATRAPSQVEVAERGRLAARAQGRRASECMRPRGGAWRSPPTQAGATRPEWLDFYNVNTKASTLRSQPRATVRGQSLRRHGLLAACAARPQVSASGGVSGGAR